MQLAYGAGLFPANATAISADIKTNYNQGGQKYSETRTITVDGFYIVTSQLDAALQEAALRTALSVPFQNLIFYTDAGVQTPLRLLNAGSITGVRIRDLAFPFKPEDYATQRGFHFTAEAEYPVLNAANLLLSFTETLSFSGGGPIYRHRLGINGVNQKQLVYPQETFRAVQQGSASGYTAAPVAPAPIWEYALSKSPDFTRTSPTRKGFGYEGYGLTWRYEYEDTGPLEGFPTLWTV